MAARETAVHQGQLTNYTIPGFSNPGFICYQSSVLQMLLHYPPFADWLNGQSVCLPDSVFEWLRSIFRNYPGARSLRSLNNANDALCHRMDKLGLFKYGNYEAADEFYTQLITRLNLELGDTAFQTGSGLLGMLNIVSIKLCPFPSCSVIRQIGQTTETCGVSGILLEAIDTRRKFYDIRLEDFLDTVWGVQVSETNCDNSGCRGHISALRASFRMAKVENPVTFPQMLPVFVNRVQTTHDNTQKNPSIQGKIDWPVIIPNQLQLDKFNWLSAQHHSYELFGVVSHFGNPRFGHYKSVVKDSVTKNWLEFDDQKISLLASRTRYDKAFETTNGYPPAAEAAWSLGGFTPSIVFYKISEVA